MGISRALCSQVRIDIRSLFPSKKERDKKKEETIRRRKNAFLPPWGGASNYPFFLNTPLQKSKKSVEWCTKKDRSYARTSIGRENVFDDVTIVEKASTTRMTMKILQISRKEGEREEDDICRHPKLHSLIFLSQATLTHILLNFRLATHTKNERTHFKCTCVEIWCDIQAGVESYHVIQAAAADDDIVSDC